ncbi:MAG TPA: CPBP family intramembrane glutamic endopeptidase [Trebonia sp.]|nr:CPBP family intramembrane glutamic endopeptidase [Trebonia sp.]
MTLSAGPEQPASPSAGAVAPSQPEPPAISARRAYAEVFIVFALFFAASIIDAGETLSGNVPAPTGSWGVFVPSAVNYLSTALLALLVVALLAARRGIAPRALGLRLPPDAGGKSSPGRAVQMAAAALLALIVGAIVTVNLETGHLAQPAHPSAPYLMYAFVESIGTGILEEMVALVFVVSTLRQARRPTAEIIVVAVLVRCSYHIYYGVGVVGIAVWAAVFVVLYLRFRSVIPLIIVHFLWDAFQFLAVKWRLIGGLGELAGAALLVAGLIIWIVAMTSRGPGKGLPSPPPGGYPPPGPFGAYPPPPPPGAYPPGSPPPPPGPGPFGTYPSGSPYPPQPSPYSHQAPPGYTQAPPPGYGPPPGTVPPPGYGPPPGTVPPPGTAPPPSPGATSPPGGAPPPR